MSRSNLRRIEPLRKHHQLRAIEGLRQAHEEVHVRRTYSLPMECCWRLHYHQQGCLQRGIGHASGCPMLRPADKVAWRYRGTSMSSFSPREIGDEGVKGTCWGGAAVVLRARESRVHGKGRQCWRVWFRTDGRELDP
jgi:hypothetical protein